MAPVRRSGVRRAHAVVWLTWLLGLGPLGCSGSDSPPERSAGEKIYGVQMHLHGSLSEGAGSMRGHNVMARRLRGAVDVLWWTDHDWRISGYTYVTGFDFEEGLSEIGYAPEPLRTGHWEGSEPMPPWARASPQELAVGTGGLEPVQTGWSRTPVVNPAKRVRLEVSDRQARSGERSLHVQVRGGGGDWERVAIAFHASRRRHVASLASGVRLRLSVLPVAGGDDARLVLSVLLSQQPPDYQGRIDYRLGWVGRSSQEFVSTVTTVRVDGRPLPLRVATVEMSQRAGLWNDWVFDVAADAERYGLGGIDNAIVELSLAAEVRAAGRLEAWVDRFRIERERLGEALFEREKEMARGLGEAGIVNHVGQEISYAAHLNVFGPRIPLANPVTHPHGYTPGEAVALAHAHDGIVSLNHFFGVATDAIGHNFPNSRRRFDARLARLIEARAYGADLLEVGYRSRGHGLPAFVDLWDGLSRAGVYITGVGVSDSHDNDVGWLEGPNNFITFVYAASPSQEDLIDALRAGRAFFGDPTRFDGRLDITTPEGGRMGQVLPVAAGPHTVVHRAEGLRPGQRIRLVRDGQPVATFSPDGARFEHTQTISVERPTFVRFEVREDESAVALSNPLYLVPDSQAGDVPRGRRAADATAVRSSR